MRLKDGLQRLAGRPWHLVLLASLIVLAGLSFVMAKNALRLQTDTLRLDQEIMMSGVESQRTGALFAQSPRNPRIVKVTATAYSPDAQQTDATPWRGALGLRIRPGRTLAVSQDLSDLLGRRVFVKGIGFRVVEDLMHPRWNKRADFCVTDGDKAAAFGVKEVEIVVVD